MQVTSVYEIDYSRVPGNPNNIPLPSKAPTTGKDKDIAKDPVVPKNPDQKAAARLLLERIWRPVKKKEVPST